MKQLEVITNIEIEYKKFPHKLIYYKEDGTEVIEKNDCNGKVYYDKVLDGYVCEKCHMSTSLK